MADDKFTRAFEAATKGRDQVVRVVASLSSEERNAVLKNVMELLNRVAEKWKIDSSVTLFGNVSGVDATQAASLLREAEDYRDQAQANRDRRRLDAAQYVATMALLLIAGFRATDDRQRTQAMVARQAFASHTDTLLLGI